MFKYSCLLLVLAIISVKSSQAEDYLLRVRPVTNLKDSETSGTIEFHAVPGSTLFVRSTLGNDSQFILRGTLRKIQNDTFELEYDCQVSELRTDPMPRLARKGKVRLILSREEELTSRLSPENDPQSLDFAVSIRPLHPLFGTREDTSGWAVRLVDADGKAVANAKGGLLVGPGANSFGLDEWDFLVEGKSDKNGLMSFTEGRESLLTRTFYAEHKGRKLYAAAHLHPDKYRSEKTKSITIKMTDSLVRWPRPKE